MADPKSSQPDRVNGRSTTTGPNSDSVTASSYPPSSSAIAPHSHSHSHSPPHTSSFSAPQNPNPTPQPLKEALASNTETSPPAPPPPYHDPNERPLCFSSTTQECLFVASVTMAVAMTSFLLGSVTVISSFAGRDLGMTSAEISWMNGASA